ncbi:MAG: sigma factor-like helix-turn-helix DNA-binding protein, partial [Verrucomicrobiota bacterium]
AQETPQTEEAWFEFEGDNAAFAETVQKALAEIPEKFSEVVTLKIWGELTFAQIAEKLDVAQNTVQSRYRYGLEKLKQLLDSERNDLVA